MAITVKRKKLTVKTIKAKIQPETPEVSEAAPEAAAPAAAQAAAPVAAVPAQASGPSYTWAGILALIAVLVCIALLLFQYLEWRHYHNIYPAAFPLKQVGVPGSVPSARTAPESQPVDVAEPVDATNIE